MKTQNIAFRCSEEQRKKLELLAAGEGTTITGVISKLLDSAQVKPVEVKRMALAFSAEKKNTSTYSLAASAGVRA